MKASALPYYASSAVTILGRLRPLPRVVGLLLRPSATTVQIPRLGLDFRVRDFMDVWCLKETFLDKDYLVHGFEPQPGWKKFAAQLAVALTAMGLVLWFATGSTESWLEGSVWARVARLAILVAGGSAVYFAALWLCGIRVAHFAKRA